MKRIISILFFVSCSHFLMAQDVAIKKNSEREEEFNEVTKRKNVLFFNCGQLVQANIGIDYIREFFQSKFIVHVPFSLSYLESQPNYDRWIDTPDDVTNYQRDRKVFDIGLGAYINTSGKRSFTHFIGPLFRLAQFYGNYEVYTFKNGGYGVWSHTRSYAKYNFTVNQTYAMLNNGLLYRATPHFNVMINFAVGVVLTRHYVTNDPADILAGGSNYSSVHSPAFQLGFCLGYRF